MMVSAPEESSHCGGDMADARSTNTATANDSGCGCCRPEPRTTEDIIRELESRRNVLDARLAGMGSR